MGQVAQDVRVALRTLLRRPAFAVTAVGILTLGLGASVAVGSLARSVLLGALPYPDGDRLVSVFEANDAGGMPEVLTSYLNYGALRDQGVFEEMAISRNQVRVVMTTPEGPETMDVDVVSPELFDLTGARAAVGRLFGPEADQRPGEHAVVVLSEEIWRGRFGQDPGVVGRSVNVNGRPYEIVGVMGSGFLSFPDPSLHADAWVPVMMGPELVHPDLLDNRINRQLPVLAKLRDGVTEEQARAELATLSARLAEAYPDSNQGWEARFKTLRELYLGDLAGPVVALLAGAGFLLLIGCANVANLLLVRATERQREVVLRRALGASRRRIAVQMMSEALVLAGLAGVLGTALAAFAVGLIVSVSPVPLPPFVVPSVDVASLLGALGLSVLTGVGFGIVPLLMGAGGDLRSSLGSAGAGTSLRGARLRRVFVVAEVATAVTLLAGAGLLVRSLAALQGVDKGFRPERVVTLSVQASTEVTSDEDLPLLAGRLTDAARSLPGVAGAAIWSPHIPGAATWYTRIRPEDRPEAPDQDLPLVRFHYVGGGAFRELGLRLVAGRGIEDQDRSDARPVIVLSESAAENLWPGQDPIGRQIRRWNRDAWATVVGVVADAKQGGRQGPEAEFTRDVYFSFQQEPQRIIALMVRTTGDPAALVPTLRAGVQSAIPDLPVYDVQPLAVRLGEEERTPAFTATLAVWYSVLAMALAVIGLYGVLAYSVSRRTREIGLRVALGAEPASIRRDVVREGLAMGVVGSVLGVALTLGVGRWLGSILYGVEPTDPVSLWLAPVALLIAVTVACTLPARKAARVDPTVALRSD